MFSVTGPRMENSRFLSLMFGFLLLFTLISMANSCSNKPEIKNPIDKIYSIFVLDRGPKYELELRWKFTDQNIGISQLDRSKILNDPICCGSLIADQKNSDQRSTMYLSAHTKNQQMMQPFQNADQLRFFYPLNKENFLSIVSPNSSVDTYLHHSTDKIIEQTQFRPGFVPLFQWDRANHLFWNQSFETIFLNRQSFSCHTGKVHFNPLRVSLKPSHWYIAFDTSRTKLYFGRSLSTLKSSITNYVPASQLVVSNNGTKWWIPFQWLGYVYLVAGDWVCIVPAVNFSQKSVIHSEVFYVEMTRMSTVQLFECGDSNQTTPRYPSKKIEIVKRDQSRGTWPPLVVDDLHDNNDPIMSWNNMLIFTMVLLALLLPVLGCVCYVRRFKQKNKKKNTKKSALAASSASNRPSKHSGSSKTNNTPGNKSRKRGTKGRKGGSPRSKPSSRPRRKVQGSSTSSNTSSTSSSTIPTTISSASSVANYLPISQTSNLPSGGLGSAGGVVASGGSNVPSGGGGEANGSQL